MVAVSDWPKGSPLNGHEHQLPFLLFEEEVEREFVSDYSYAQNNDLH